MPQTAPAGLGGTRDLFDLSGKVAVVTGGNRRHRHDDGARPAPGWRVRQHQLAQAQVGEAVAAELSDTGTVTSVADLAEEERQRLATEVGRLEEGIHAATNNAGTNLGAGGVESARLHTVVDLNLKTLFYLTGCSCRWLRRTVLLMIRPWLINVAHIDGLPCADEYPNPP